MNGLSREERAHFTRVFVRHMIADQVRALREHAGLSQAALAAKVGTKQSCISRIENSTGRMPSVATLRKLASFFDVAIEIRFCRFSEMLAAAKTAPQVPASFGTP